MDFTTPLQHVIAVIDRWLAYIVYADQSIPGLSVGIVYDDKVIFSKGYGYANLEQKTRTTDQTCYRIASISKIFTTIATLQLVEQGNVRLDDRVQDYLPWFTSSAVTVRHLLTHTSGLDRDGNTPHWIDFRFPSLEEIQHHIAEGADVFQPLERWKYSNYGFTLLGEIIRQASGISYEAYVTRNIVEQVGLEHTAPMLNNDILEHLAIGYSRTLPDQPKEAFPAIATNVMASATGFSSNVVDLCHFMSALFAGNTALLQDETKRDMLRVQWLNANEATHWCLGFETWKVGEQRLYGHGGSFPGYKSRFGIDPQRKIGVVILTNSIDAAPAPLVDGIWSTINYFVMHAEAFNPSRTPREELDEYAGTYRSIWGDSEIAVVADQLLMYDPAQTSPVADLDCLQYEQDGQYKIVSGSGFGHVGELARFLREGDKINVVVVGSNPAYKVELLS